MPPELKAIHIARVAATPKKRKVKKPTPGEGAPRDTAKYVEQLERKVRNLEVSLKEAKDAIATEKAHLEQVKRRENKAATLLLQGKMRQLTAEYDAKIARLEEALAAKEEELAETRKLAMSRLFS